MSGVRLPVPCSTRDSAGCENRALGSARLTPSTTSVWLRPAALRNSRKDLNPAPRFGPCSVPSAALLTWLGRRLPVKLRMTVPPLREGFGRGPRDITRTQKIGQLRRICDVCTFEMATTAVVHPDDDRVADDPKIAFNQSGRNLVLAAVQDPDVFVLAVVAVAEVAGVPLVVGELLGQQAHTPGDLSVFAFLAQCVQPWLLSGPRGLGCSVEPTPKVVIVGGDVVLRQNLQAEQSVTRPVIVRADETPECRSVHHVCLRDQVGRHVAELLIAGDEAGERCDHSGIRNLLCDHVTPVRFTGDSVD